MKKYRLISFKLCPFVQRSVIVLKTKHIDFDIEYIDLANKPDWFLKLSPLGKVPVLQVGDDVLFESAIIMEYLDEVTPPSLHPTDPLLKAKARAWIEFSSHLLGLQYQWTHVKTEADYTAKTEELRAGLKRFAAELKGPWFAGDTMQLTDVAIAPLFARFAWLAPHLPTDILEGLPALSAYSAKIAATESITNSVLPEVPELFRAYLKKTGAHIAKWL
ncbi:glutathione S-transferase family protein [Turneriella parva]|uniref:Glutathione S-transferase domain-containing protein n=1 Tax=Turneriella parva (strain ATCC BAA-1111 / DSM 21527 / NCTC 11395 / H) TaxID=869212 RepID=I4B0M9_TURPD|nr:glutathione S-transferase family protein [Turneriella parva]AFM10836.1 Glutathione S-transferase domain-containing protein [Turneriella parva DSM 21527]